jgi:hypothetical protein
VQAGAADGERERVRGRENHRPGRRRRGGAGLTLRPEITRCHGHRDVPFAVELEGRVDGRHLRGGKAALVEAALGDRDHAAQGWRHAQRRIEVPHPLREGNIRRDQDDPDGGLRRDRVHDLDVPGVLARRLTAAMVSVPAAATPTSAARRKDVESLIVT